MMSLKFVWISFLTSSVWIAAWMYCIDWSTWTQYLLAASALILSLLWMAFCAAAVVARGAKDAMNRAQVRRKARQSKMQMIGDVPARSGTIPPAPVASRLKLGPKTNAQPKQHSQKSAAAAKPKGVTHHKHELAFVTAQQSLILSESETGRSKRTLRPINYRY
jgi:hypothetical protein